MQRRIAYAGVGLLLAFVLIAGLRELARARTFQVFGRLVAHVDTPDRRVALTFDDGPTSKLADSLARVLSARSVRATFFVIGADLAAAPQAGHLLAAAGHELG
ncbi:MAG: polysaccharide deacetylase family protein, partial [Gemmatimonadota bacterium]|nr:polysaccharide deacetylase family protein [Gemmatimonadota bacterium]